MNDSLALAANCVNPHDDLLRRVLAPGPAATLSRHGEPGRDEAERFVAAKFAAAWQAQVTVFMPWLLSLRCMSRYAAVAGIRPAAHEHPFLEQYLDAPVEQVLGGVVNMPILRREIVEIGNLVADMRGSSHLLFLLLTAALHDAGYRWIVFTATQALRNNLTKLGYPLHLLAPADAARLDPAARALWGNYYRSDPQVMAGSLDDARRLADARPLLRRVLVRYREQVTAFALRLKEDACRR